MDIRKRKHRQAVVALLALILVSCDGPTSVQPPTEIPAAIPLARMEVVVDTTLAAVEDVVVSTSVGDFPLAEGNFADFELGSGLRTFWFETVDGTPLGAASAFIGEVGLTSSSVEGYYSLNTSGDGLATTSAFAQCNSEGGVTGSLTGSALMLVSLSPDIAGMDCRQYRDFERAVQVTDEFKALMNAFNSEFASGVAPGDLLDPDLYPRHYDLAREARTETLVFLGLDSESGFLPPDQKSPEEPPRQGVEYVLPVFGGDLDLGRAVDLDFSVYNGSRMHFEVALVRHHANGQLETLDLRSLRPVKPWKFWTDVTRISLDNEPGVAQSIILLSGLEDRALLAGDAQLERAHLAALLSNAALVVRDIAALSEVSCLADAAEVDMGLLLESGQILAEFEQILLDMDTGNWSRLVDRIFEWFEVAVWNEAAKQQQRFACVSGVLKDSKTYGKAFKYVWAVFKGLEISNTIATLYSLNRYDTPVATWRHYTASDNHVPFAGLSTETQGSSVRTTGTATSSFDPILEAQLVVESSTGTVLSSRNVYRDVDGKTVLDFAPDIWSPRFSYALDEVLDALSLGASSADQLIIYACAGNTQTADVVADCTRIVPEADEGGGTTVPVEIATLSVDPSPASAGEIVQVTWSLEGATQSTPCSIVFGDGTSSEVCTGVSQATHVYSSPGEYDLVLTVGDHSLATATRTVSVIEATEGPNLVLHSPFVDPPAPRHGEAVDFCFSVANNGDQSTEIADGSANIDVYYGTLETSNRVQGPFIFPIVAGASVGPFCLNPFSDRGDETATEGRHTVFAFVDTLREVAESNEDDNLLEFQFDVRPPPPDTSAPTITAFRVNGSTSPSPVENRGGIGVSISASDASGLERAELLIDGIVVQQDHSAPFAFTWAVDERDTGQHLISARVLDRAGNVARPGAISLSVDIPAKLACSGGVANGDLRITASQSLAFSVDTELGVPLNSVIFAVNGTPRSTDNTAPHDWNWTVNHTDNGTYEVTATAVDENGLSASCSFGQVLVDVEDPNSMASLSGTVTDSASGGTIANASVNFAVSTATTDSVGAFVMNGLPCGEPQTLSASAAEYVTHSESLTLACGETNTVLISMASVTLDEPNLAFSVAPFIAPSKLVDGDTGELCYSVTNIGAAAIEVPSGSHLPVAYVTADDSTGPQRLGSLVAYGTIQPGDVLPACTNAFEPWDGSAREATYSYEVFLDPTDTVIEADESDNVGTTSVAVGAAPQPSGLSGVSAVAAGANHSLALRGEFALAWGINNDGELGDGTTTNRSLPTPLGVPTGLVAIEGGADHTLALLSNGTIMAWGGNEWGELGTMDVCTGNGCYSSTPIAAGDFTLVADISAGAGQSAAVRENGNVFMWGRNYGSTPVLIQGISNIIDVELGQNHALALDSAGTVYAWGSNGAGELGTGDYFQSRDPVVVSGLPGIVDIAAGEGLSAAVAADGTVYTWGRNSYGQLGIGEAGGSSTRPQRVPGLSDIVEIDAGYWHIVVRRQNGVVLAWGDNFHGQLGDGTVVARNLPTYVGGAEGASQIAAGNWHTLAALNDTTVLAWGRNTTGQLGDGSTTGRSTPQPVEERP